MRASCGDVDTSRRAGAARRAHRRDPAGYVQRGIADTDCAHTSTVVRLPLVLASAFLLGACGTAGPANGWAAPRSDAPRTASAAPRPASPRPLSRPAAPPAERPAPAPTASSAALEMPVVGFDPADLRDSFDAPRSGGRTHRSIDLAAPRGTPLVAVVDGTIRRKHWNALGGRTLYLTSADGRFDYYYAHLDEYAAGIEIGTEVKRGETIGTVGSTGNARGPHLHFQILDRSGRGRGTPINPYPLLRGGGVASR